MLSAIENRRSIRKYKDIPVPREIIEKILSAGILAPSSKNRQPWEFIVVSGSSKKEMLAVMEQGLAREKETPLLPGSASFLQGAEYTMEVMAQAPVVILIMNPLGLPFHQELTPEERIFEICNSQSLGAAIENMALMATALGIGSLWVCDIYFAYAELEKWVGKKDQLFAAFVLGYADEMPAARPREPLASKVSWRT